MKNILLKRTSPWVSSFRKLALTVWDKPKDPTTYGKVELEISELTSYLIEKNKITATSISINHAIGKIMGLVFEKYPDINITLIRNKPKHRKKINIFFHTHIQTKKGYDLLGITVEDINKKSLEDIAEEVNNKTNALKANKTKHMENSKRILTSLPLIIIKPLVKCLDSIMYSLNLNLKWMGLPQDPYGSLGITSIAALGMEEAYVPLFPFSRLGMILAIGKKQKKPVVINDKIEIKPMITLIFTLDHRYFDGAHLAKPLRYLKKIIKNPKLYNI